MRYRGLRWPAVTCGAVWLAVVAGLLLVLDLPDRIAADLMGDIQQGLQTTGKLFGINTIADVADLVAKGFANRRGSQEWPKPEATENGGVVGGTGDGPLAAGRTPSMMMIMMKLLGLDGNQLGAMLVNGIVFLAHIIGTNLGAFQKPSLETASPPFLRDPPAYGKPAPDAPETGTNESAAKPSPGANPLEWLLRNPSKQFRVLLEQVQHSDLTDHLDRELRQLDHFPPEDTDCVRLLMCKIKPFIWKMQSVVRDKIVVGRESATGHEKAPGQAGQPQPATTPSGEEIMKGIHDNLPSAEEFRRQSEACEQQFRQCSRQAR